MSVLAVDDNAANVALLKAMIQQQGLSQVYVETDPRRVEGHLPDYRPDLVLLDLHMPHLDGQQVLVQIQQFAAGSYLPVLVLTADTTTAARDRALSQGAQDFLTKPLDPTETIQRIANLLQTRQLFTSLRRSNFPLPAHLAPLPRESDTDVLKRIKAVLATEAISPVYQPIIDIHTMRTVGYEGLSRFADSSRGGPDRWFSDAFRVDLGVDLEWLAATRLLPFLDIAAPETFVAINMSPATILHIAEHNLCERYPCPRLVIEVTEHVPVEDYQAVHLALADIRSNGARLAADDLGSGYAGFRHLISLRPDIIKLDISLVRGIHLSSGARALARALVAFAADVGATLIAEGVEDAAELDVLQDIGVSWAQGYHLARPAPPEQWKGARVGT